MQLLDFAEVQYINLETFKKEIRNDGKDDVKRTQWKSGYNCFRGKRSMTMACPECGCEDDE